MTKFEPINSSELSILKDVFNQLSYLQIDVNLVYIVESYIYSTIREYYSSKEEMEEKQIKVEYRTKYGLKDGEYKQWYITGKLSVNCFYINDKKEGQYKRWNHLGNKFEECFYKDDLKEGQYKRWQTYDNQTQYDYQDTLYIECTYSKDKKDGKYIEWWPNGKKCSEYNYLNDKLEGEYKEWMQNGNIFVKKFYTDNQPFGKSENWYLSDDINNHVKSTEILYPNDKMNGIFKGWHKNGNKKFELNFYVINIKDGEYKQWSEDGILTHHLIYQNNEVVTTIVNTTTNN